MTTPRLDIFKKDARGNPVWLEAVMDHETARRRLADFASVLPGEYFAFDQITHKIIQLESDQVECR
jgi:hypothetical protein